MIMTPIAAWKSAGKKIGVRDPLELVSGALDIFAYNFIMLHLLVVVGIAPFILISLHITQSEFSTLKVAGIALGLFAVAATLAKSMYTGKMKMKISLKTLFCYTDADIVAKTKILKELDNQRVKQVKERETIVQTKIEGKEQLARPISASSEIEIF